ncbi:MAG: AAA family ATPase [Vulcanimicrobiota bacterium]
MNPKDRDPQGEHVRLQSLFGFSKMPFTKYIWSSKMFQARSQKELIEGLRYSLEVKGVSLVIGSPGLGKSISLRRFKEDLSTQYFQPFYLWNTRTSPVGFLRSLCRIFQIQPYHYIADMFDAVSEYLGSLEENTGKYPLLILDDCDNLSREVLENIRIYGQSENIMRLYGIANRQLPTRINKKRALKEVGGENLDWFFKNNFLSDCYNEEYGIVDEFFKIRMMLDNATEKERIIAERKLIKSAAKMMVHYDNYQDGTNSINDGNLDLDDYYDFDDP